jgi:hypothetical protein
MYLYNLFLSLSTKKSHIFSNYINTRTRTQKKHEKKEIESVKGPSLYFLIVFVMFVVLEEIHLNSLVIVFGFFSRLFSHCLYSIQIKLKTSI